MDNLDQEYFEHGVDEIDGPLYPDGCRHGLERYVGSFRALVSGSSGVRAYDVYVHDESVFGRASVCIRYGAEADEYFSGPRIDLFIEGEGHDSGEPYRGALRLLRKHGRFSWTRKTPHRWRGYEIRFDPPPIPDRRHDWAYAHRDYDGPPDPRCGRAASLEDACREIDELEEA